jgi:cytidine deaminase
VAAELVLKGASVNNRNRREALGIVAAISLSLTQSAAAGSDQRKSEKDMPEPDPKVLAELAKRAKSISEKAYCPYSKFHVGAVVLTEDGQMYEGCNVENASYGLTICAERNAIFHMVAQSKQKIVAIVIYTPTDKPTAPCGACRQVINEFGPEAFVMSVCDGSEVLKAHLSELLPAAFGPANLRK